MANYAKAASFGRGGKLSVGSFAGRRDSATISGDDTAREHGTQSTANIASHRDSSRAHIRRDMMQLARQNRHTVSQKMVPDGPGGRYARADPLLSQSSEMEQRHLGVDSLASAYITAPQHNRLSNRKLIRDTMSIPVNFGTFKSKMIGIRPRNQNVAQNSSKLNMQMLEQNLQE